MDCTAAPAVWSMHAASACGSGAPCVRGSGLLVPAVLGREREVRLEALVRDREPQRILKKRKTNATTQRKA